MLDIIRYTSDYKDQWDEVINNSRNGTFLFLRDYMDYHSDRFIDCSFLILRKGKAEAAIPGNYKDNCFFSHQGLTYGGLVSSSKICTADVLQTFILLNNELKNIGIRNVVYKPVPLVYHTIPAQEDLYALFLNNAERIGCNLSSTINQNNKLRFNESRKCGIRKSKNEGVKIFESFEFSVFWKILEANLFNKFNTKPVHSLKEVEMLNIRFPKNIKLYVAEYKGMIVAGTILYVMKNLVHVQYISANEAGKEIGALDLLFDNLINKEYQHIAIFDFGQSTDRMGHYLNENLIFQKEGFGGRGTVYDIYQYSIKY